MWDRLTKEDLIESFNQTHELMKDYQG